MYQLAPKQFPDGKTNRWYNVYDSLDPVANPPFVGDPTVSGEFLSSGRERAYDIEISNPLRPDTHNEVGYVQSLKTTWLIKDFLLRHAL